MRHHPRPLTGMESQKTQFGTSLVAWWLRLCTSNARGASSIPGQVTKITQAAQHNQKQEFSTQQSFHSELKIKKTLDEQKLNVFITTDLTRNINRVSSS